MSKHKKHIPFNASRNSLSLGDMIKRDKATIEWVDNLKK